MPAIVRLNDTIDALDMQPDGSSSFLDCDTGQVATVSHDEAISPLVGIVEPKSDASVASIWMPQSLG
jgi:hypothetical protein